MQMNMLYVKRVRRSKMKTAQEKFNSLIFDSELNAHKTNHILHLLLTIVTFGIWGYIWMLIAASGLREQNKIRKQYGMKTKFNAPFWTIVIMSIAIIYVLVATKI